MPIVQLILILVVIGVLLWLVNTYAAKFMDAKIVTIINVVVVVCVILWIITLFFPAALSSVNSMRIGGR
jgi:peptidoglycan biosynthesis protein MviN/MurJ (putative lipid II flippase)